MPGLDMVTAPGASWPTQKSYMGHHIRRDSGAWHPLTWQGLLGSCGEDAENWDGAGRPIAFCKPMSQTGMMSPMTCPRVALFIRWPALRKHWSICIAQYKARQLRTGCAVPCEQAFLHVYRQ